VQIALSSAYQEYLVTFKLMTSQVVQRSQPYGIALKDQYIFFFTTSETFTIYEVLSLKNIYTP